MVKSSMLTLRDSKESRQSRRSSRFGEEKSYLKPLANYCSFGVTGTDVRPHLRNGSDKRRLSPIHRKEVNTEKRSVIGPAKKLTPRIPIAYTILKMSITVLMPQHDPPSAHTTLHNT